MQGNGIQSNRATIRFVTDYAKASSRLLAIAPLAGLISPYPCHVEPCLTVPVAFSTSSFPALRAAKISADVDRRNFYGAQPPPIFTTRCSGGEKHSSRQRVSFFSLNSSTISFTFAHSPLSDEGRGKRTVSTGAGLKRTILLATEPSSMSINGPWPWAPMTTR